MSDAINNNNTNNNTTSEDDFTSQIRRVSGRIRGGSAPPPETAAQAKKGKKKGKKSSPTAPNDGKDPTTGSSPGENLPTETASNAAAPTPAGRLDPSSSSTHNASPTPVNPATIQIPASALARNVSKNARPAQAPTTSTGDSLRVPIIAIHTPSGGAPTVLSTHQLIDPNLLGEMVSPQANAFEAPEPAGLIARDAVTNNCDGEL